MPNIKSAEKRMRTAEIRRAKNQSVKSALLTSRQKLYAAMEKGETSKLDEYYRGYCSLLDKAVKKGTITANTASRRKSRATHRLAALASE
jgi:small subunit ribosomal protein S20